jgi:predicted nuclease of predicted toxin-antitoxin system
VKCLLFDHGLPRSTAALLTQAGWDVIHVFEIGMSRADDVDILQRAQTEARFGVTLDADFHSLLAISGEHALSVIRIRKEGVDAAAFAALLQGIWPCTEDALKGGAMLTVTERSVRVRRLPIVRT